MSDQQPEVDFGTRQAKLAWPDVHKALPFWLISILVHNPGCYLAGGAIRSIVDNTPIQDYDLFFTDKETRDKVEKEIGIESAYFRCPNDKLISMRKYGVKIQLCSPLYYPTASALLNSFDLTASCFVVQCHKVTSWMLIMHPDTLADIAYKRIKLNNVTYPIATINRIHKYRQKGYTITDDVWKDLLTRIRGLSQEDFEDPDKMALYID